jgi:hypothetical protein
VNDATTDALKRSLHAQVRNLSARTDPDALFARIERRAARNRRLLASALALLVVVAGGVGFALGRDDSGRPVTPIAAQDGTPPAVSGDAAFEPEDVEAARAAVIAAFQDAYGGGTPQAVRNDAIQRGDELEALTGRVLANAQVHGYTAEQLAGTSITVSDVGFIDAEHSVVRFTLTIPGHGVVLADRVGYAVFSDGRWKVALRTACDLLSLSGVGTACPPS